MRFGDVAIRLGYASEEQCERAEGYGRENGMRIGEVLVLWKIIDDYQRVIILSEMTGIPLVKLREIDIDHAVVKQYPADQLKKFKAVPISQKGNRVIMAIHNPSDLGYLENLSFELGGIDIDSRLATETDIDWALLNVFAIGQFKEALAIDSKNDESLHRAILDLDADPQADNLIEKVVQAAFKEALSKESSDVHFEVMETHVRVRIRVDGLLRTIMTLPKQSKDRLASYIKYHTEGMDIATKMVPQDGRWELAIGGMKVDLRVSSFPMHFGEKIVVRILDKRILQYELGTLGITQLNKYRPIIKSTRGMVLITGPTGAGKTTTLYATVNEINDEEKNVCTIEDPIEYVLDGVNQTQINIKAGMTFKTSLEKLLRQDPDIVLVGEIRDTDTAQIAIQAATTGHLVLASLHTYDSASAAIRLMDLGVEPFMVASGVTGILAQRLPRTLCDCKVPYDALWNGEPIQLCKPNPKGCYKCEGKGFKGRTAISELLIVTKEIRDAIYDKRPAETILEIAKKQGTIPLREDGYDKVKQGITTLDEILRVTDYREEEGNCIPVITEKGGTHGQEKAKLSTAI